MNEFEDRESAFLERARAREVESLRKYGAGYTREQWEEFQRIERERVGTGVPDLSQLGVPQRVYNVLRRFGVRTVNGVGQILEEGRKPYNFGPKARQITQERFTNYISQNRTS